MTAGEEALKLLKDLIKETSDGNGSVHQGAIYAEELDLEIWMCQAKSVVRGQR